MDDLLRDLQEIPFKREEALVTGRLRAFLDGVGTPIGHFDVMIAGTALTHGLTMVTANL
jgi:tRNA(fMet)-specific endonuclease VapC